MRPEICSSRSVTDCSVNSNSLSSGSAPPLPLLLLLPSVWTGGAVLLLKGSLLLRHRVALATPNTSRRRRSGGLEGKDRNQRLEWRLKTISEHSYIHRSSSCNGFPLKGQKIRRDKDVQQTDATTVATRTFTERFHNRLLRLLSFRIYSKKWMLTSQKIQVFYSKHDLIYNEQYHKWIHVYKD